MLSAELCRDVYTSEDMSRQADMAGEAEVRWIGGLRVGAPPLERLLVVIHSLRLRS